MTRRFLAPLAALAVMASLMPASHAAPGSGLDTYTSPDRRTGALPFVKIDGMTDGPQGEGMKRFTEQKLEWERCGRRECAEISAPMDYGNPDGPAITLKLKRKKASGQRLGSVLMNPGGPGAPGTDMAERDYPGLGQYDIVGFDPRGTGKSTPVQCYDKQDDRLVPESEKREKMDVSPDNDAEYKEMLATQRSFGDSCAAHSGVYLQYLTTENVIQDMDLIRTLVGDEKLNFVGYSYGTYLGAMYANYFPSKVGRMVLDSPVNLTTDDTISQSQGFDRALDLFVAWAAEEGDLGTNKDTIKADIKKFLTDLDSKPLDVDGRELTQSSAITGVITFLYGTEDEWRMLQKGLQDAYDGDGTTLLMAADMMNGREHDVYDTSYYAFPVMACADSPDRGLKADYEHWADEQKKAPFFGWFFGPSVTCDEWPVAPTKYVKLTAPTSAPIVVVGSKGDPATPYEYAPWMRDQLGNARLVTWDGAGHGTYGGGNECVDGAIDDYLVEGTVPTDGLVCKP